jgi:DNA-binding SARP family transcriptional activator/predicted ATPase
MHFLYNGINCLKVKLLIKGGALANLLIRLFGPSEVMLNGKRRTAFHSDKERALLAYLCIETEVPHRREKLAGLFWPDYPESAARTNLRNTLAHLRKVIGDRPQDSENEPPPNFLHITPKTVQFNTNSEAWVDASAFLLTLEKSSATVAELESAVSWYHDVFLAGFSLAGSNIFDEWLIIQRERFSRLAITALQRLVEAYKTQGEYKQALIHARRMVTLDPLREGAQQTYMRMLTYNGQTNQAIVQYEKYARLLADEIGVEPLDETTRLCSQIRDGTLKPPQSDEINLPVFLKYKDDSTTAKTFFVGFENEMARLHHSLDQVLNGQGQVIFIIGEPGCGKSSLASEFIQQAMASNADLLAVIGRCNAYTGIGDPYLPFREMMDLITGDIETRWAGGEITGTHARRLWGSQGVVLPAILEYGQDLIDRLIPGASLLARVQAAVPLHGSQLQKLIEGKKLYRSEKDKLDQADLFDQYTKVLQVISQKSPLILIVDDLQWADPGSISFLFHLGRRLRGSKILLIGAYRPDEVALGRPTVTSGLERHPLETVIHEFQRHYGDMMIDLDNSDGRKFIDSLIDSEPNCLTDDFRDVLFHHTGGHPLFTIELLRGMQSRGELTRDDTGRWVVDSDLNWKFLPPRVEAVIAERVQRLPKEAQSILMAASVEGEEFTTEVIAQVMGIEEERVLGWLSGPLAQKHKLVQAQDLEWMGDQRLSHYRFRHFLFQKFLYDQLDSVQRAHFHQSVGTALEGLHGENTTDNLAVQLARHFEEAGMTVKAVEYLLQAGNRAARLFANDEAIAHFKHGIKLVETLGDTPQRDQLELALQLALGVPLMARHGFSGEELAKTYGRAWELTRGGEASPERYQTLVGLASYNNLRGDFLEAIEIGKELLRIAKQLRDPGLTTLAHHHLSVSLLYLGKPTDFLDHRERMVALYDSQRDRPLGHKLGFDSQLSNLSHAGYAYFFLGYPDKARHLSLKAVKLAKALGHPFFLSFTLAFAGYSALYRRDLETAREMALETIAVASEHRHPLWLGCGLAVLGSVMSVEGNLKEGIIKIQRGQEILKNIGAWVPYTSNLTFLAGIYLNAGKKKEGLAVIDESLTRIENMRGWCEAPEVHRLQGELLLLEGGMEVEAESCFKSAIKVAKNQNAKGWELRATVSLCRLWQGQGKREQARGMLENIYAWFTEGFNTPDLTEAKSLLEALS